MYFYKKLYFSFQLKKHVVY